MVILCDMSSKLQAVIFDADGTLLDTREFIYRAFEQTFADHGQSVPSRETLLQHMGKSLVEMYEALAPEVDADIEKLVLHHKELHLGELLPLVAPYDGLHNLFGSLRTLGMKIAVCTNRDTSAQTLFEHIGVRNEIDMFVTKSDVHNPKPDPEGIQKILTEFSLTPREAVMVGDTEADMGAGKNAGVAIVIGVTHGFGTEKILRETGAHHIVGHLNEILPIVGAYHG